jgi:flavin-dependent dehydrogenase
VGDAASLVDPISGEGIYYALYSGYNAALSIISCINGKNKNLKRIYFRKNRKIYFLLLNTNKLLNKLLYTKYGYIFIKIGLSNRFFIFILKKLFS